LSPHDSSEILQRQNLPPNLRLLIAQRRLYARAKIFSNCRLIGEGILALVGPVIGAASPSTAGALAAITGAWIFLSRTALARAASIRTEAAASIQEQFDVDVLGIPPSPIWSPTPPETIADAAGPDWEQAVDGENVRDWYRIPAGVPSPAAVLICQRSNVAYTARLQLRFAAWWPYMFVGWACLMLVTAALRDATFLEIVLGVVMPTLPSVLDSLELRRDFAASAQRNSLVADEIEKEIRSRPTRVHASTLRNLQDHILQLRSSAPLVPERFYGNRREANERAMSEAAADLARVIEVQESES